MSSEMQQHAVWSSLNGYQVTSELFLDLIFTGLCNCSCPFCISRTREYAVPDTAAWKEAVSQAFGDFPVRHVILLGGEATVDPLFWERMDYLLPYLSDPRIEDVILTTNGLRLRDPAFLERLLQYPLTSVNLSCMHYEKEVNDRCFGNDTLSAGEIRDLHGRLNQAGRTMRINTNVWRGNLDTPEEMRAFVRTFQGCAEAVKFSPLMRTDMFDTTEEVTEYTRSHAIPEPEIRILFDSFLADAAEGAVDSNTDVLGFLDYRECVLEGQKVLLKYGQVEDKYDRNKVIPTLKLYPNGALTNEWDFRKNRFFRPKK